MKKKDLVKLYAAYKAGCLGDNILDTYFNFFVNIILDDKMQTITDVEIKNRFQKRYQINLPLGLIRQVLSIGVANGSIIDDKGAYLPKREILLKYKFSEKDFDDLWRKLLDSFDNYCRKNSLIINNNLEDKILLAIDNTDEIILSSDKLDESEGMDEFDFAWYSFVKESAESDAYLFDFITALCASNITRQALFYTGVEGEENTEYKGLNIYLDSPMVFALLGMDSPERENSYKILLEDMKKAGCIVQVLDHNFQEVEGIINRAAGWAVSTQYDIRKANNAARFFHDSQMDQEDIADFCSEIENRLNELGVLIKETNYDVYQDQFQEDEIALFDMIQQRYSEQNLALLPEKADSIKVDVRSIVMIYRERQGKTAVQVSKAQHIMLTTNNAVANVCKKYESNRSLVSGHIPACISADLFGAILWFSSPKEMMNYQRKKMLADCYDFLQPSKSLIEKYVASLDSARQLGEIDEKKFLFMRTHPIVLDTLMNITRGDYARFNDRTYLEVYDSIVAQSEQKYILEAQAHDRTKEELEEEQKQKEELEHNLKEIQSKKNKEEKALTNRIESLERKLKEKEQIEEERREKELNKKSKLWGTIITCVIFGVPYIILLSVTELLKGYFPNISWYSIVAVAVLILATAIVGICFKRLNALCIEIVRKKLQKRMRVEE